MQNKVKEGKKKVCTEDFYASSPQPWAMSSLYL